MHEYASRTQRPQLPAPAPIQDWEGEVREEVDDFIVFLAADRSDSEIASRLMVFLARIDRLSELDKGDYLNWAITHCYRWTPDHERAQAAYLAQLFQAKGGAR